MLIEPRYIRGYPWAAARPRMLEGLPNLNRLKTSKGAM
jgi:hypothetical protein